MRHLVLSDDGYHVVPNAYHRMLAACYFPESARDQEQALLLASIEQAEFNRVGAEAYKPSQIIQATSRMIQKRTARYYSVGFVALSFIWLKLNGVIPSLNKAAIMAGCAANEFRGVRWWNSLDPQSELRETAVNGDPSTVERIFREYRSVAHICAASVSAGSYLNPIHIWDQSPEVVGSLIQTSASLQVLLEGATDTSDWNLWDVTKHFPDVLRDWPVLPPDRDLQAWLRRGFFSAVEQGFIRDQGGGTMKVPRGT